MNKRLYNLSIIVIGINGISGLFKTVYNNYFIEYIYSLSDLLLVLLFIVVLRVLKTKH